MVRSAVSTSFKKGATNLLLMLAAMIFAETVAAQRYPFFNIGIEQGLIQSQIFAMAQDSAGHLWAGTLGGLSCYDGRVFRSFSVRDGLPSNTITALQCDKRKGLLWIGTNRGMSCYDGYRFRNYTFTGQTNPGGNTVLDIAIDAAGNLWCIAGRNLYRLDEGKVTSVKLPAGCEIVTALTAAIKDGGIWIGILSSSSIYHNSSGAWDSVSLPKPFYVRRIYEDAGRRLLVLGGAGLLRYNSDDSWQVLYSRKNAEDPFPYAMAQSQDGSYWLSTTAGGVLQLRDSSVLHRFGKNTGLSDILIRDLLCDAEGNIWLASNGEGLYRFSGAVFTAVDERSGLAGPQVSCIAQDANGVVYFGTYDGGMYRYTAGVAKPISFPGEKNSGAINSFLLQGNILWVGTQQIGLWQYNVISGAMKRYAPKKLEGEVRDMQEDADGIWLANGKGMVHIGRDSMHVVPVPSSMVEAFTLIGADSILLATAEGLKLFSADSIRSFRTGTAADSAQIVCIDYRDGVVWMGTVDDGVFGYRPGGGSLHVTRRDGLQSGFVYNIYPAPDGSVWAGTGYGICHIFPNGGMPIVRFYGRSAGLTGMESNRNAVLPLPDGRIWFGTTGGAVLYHPETPAAKPKALSLQLQSVQLFGENITDTTLFKGTTPLYGLPKNLRLPWQKNSLTFSFHAVSLSGSETIKYRYRLDGLSAPWSEWSTNSTVTFSALPPGKYELLVQSSIDGETPQPNSLRYAFEIITPFHKTALFRFLIIAACIVLGVGLQYAAARGKRRRLAQFDAVRREEQARVRQRTAEDFHDEVGNKLTRINVLTNVLRSKVGATPDAARIIDQIQDNAGQLYGGTRDILWALQPSNDNLYQVMHRIRDFGRDLFGDTDTQFVMEEVPAAWKDYRLPMDASRNLIMIFKEALNNTLKYAGATQVAITPLMQDSELTLTLCDNGEGFDCKTVRRGQGLANMETRAKRLAGRIAVTTMPGKGTTVALQIKIPQNKGARMNGSV